MNLPRTIEPEWLDELAPGEPRALRSRRDLRRINALMMNSTIIARELRRAFPGDPPCRIAEIGAGDGTFMLRIAEQLAPYWPVLDVVLVDQQSLVSPETSERMCALGWRPQVRTAEVFRWLALAREPVFDVIVANLFLHHFNAPKLASLLSLISLRTRLLIACEPQRSGRALFGSHLLGVIGCNDVTRHDAVVSVRAGFSRRELSDLWPPGSGWVLRETAQGLFSHCFVAAHVGVHIAADRDGHGP